MVTHCSIPLIVMKEASSMRWADLCAVDSSNDNKQSDERRGDTSHAAYDEIGAVVVANASGERHTVVKNQ